MRPEREPVLDDSLRRLLDLDVTSAPIRPAWPGVRARLRSADRGPASWRWAMGTVVAAAAGDILDVETGAMLEAWADLYGMTGREEHRALMERYDRPRRVVDHHPVIRQRLPGERLQTVQYRMTSLAAAGGPQQGPV